MKWEWHFATTECRIAWHECVQSSALALLHFTCSYHEYAGNEIHFLLRTITSFSSGLNVTPFQIPFVVLQDATTPQRKASIPFKSQDSE